MNFVSARHSCPSEAATLSTFVSALVACIRKSALSGTPCRVSGVMRTPMLVGDAMA